MSRSQRTISSATIVASSTGWSSIVARVRLTYTTPLPLAWLAGNLRRSPAADRSSIVLPVSPAAPTSLYVLLGRPVAGNPTQEMIEAAFAAASLDGRYVYLEVEEGSARGAVHGLRALGVQVRHVAVPHKVLCCRCSTGSPKPRAWPERSTA